MGVDILNINDDHPPHDRSHAEQGIEEGLERHFLIHSMFHLLLSFFNPENMKAQKDE
jgi:hypothetical protein